MRKRAELGGGLIYFLMLSAILGVVIATLQRKAAEDKDDIRTEDLKTMRDGIYKRVSALASAEDALRASYKSNHASNASFIACLNNAQTCSFKSPLQRGEFLLYDPSNNQPIQVRSGEKGGPCTGNQCVFEARTYFWVTCSASAPNCKTPESLSTLTQIQILPQFFSANTSAIKTATIAPKPSSLTNPSNAADASFVEKLANSIPATAVTKQTQLCPPGAEIGGFDDNGNVKCECVGGFAFQTGTDVNTGMPICRGADQTCPSGQEFRGFTTTSDGKFQKVCVTPQFYDCIIVTGSGNNELYCGTDSRGMERFIQGATSSRTNCIVDGNDVVKCDPMEVKCCSQSY